MEGCEKEANRRKARKVLQENGEKLKMKQGSQKSEEEKLKKRGRAHIGTRK